jgi:hypothetical protein
MFVREIAGAFYRMSRSSTDNRIWAMSPFTHVPHQHTCVQIGFKRWTLRFHKRLKKLCLLVFSTTNNCYSASVVLEELLIRSRDLIFSFIYSSLLICSFINKLFEQCCPLMTIPRWITRNRPPDTVRAAIETCWSRCQLPSRSSRLGASPLRPTAPFQASISIAGLCLAAVTFALMYRDRRNFKKSSLYANNLRRQSKCFF